MIACVVICDTFSLPFTKLMKGCYNMPCMLVLFRWVCFVSLGVVLLTQFDPSMKII